MKIHCPMLLLLISVSALANPCEAQDKDYMQLYSTCLREAGGARNATVAACADRVSREAEAEMETLYQKLYRGIAQKSRQDAQALGQAQQSWSVYRNSHCKLAGKYVGSPMYAYCPMQLNIQRVKDLREMTEASGS